MQNCHSSLHNHLKLSVAAAALIVITCSPGCTMERAGRSKLSTQQTRGNTVNSLETIRESPCGLRLTVTGSQFSPQACMFQVITPGEPCGPNKTCPSQYALLMKAGVKPNILEVNLVNIKEFRQGKYQFVPEQGVRDFNGYALDGNTSVRNLLRGEIVLEQPANESEAFEKSNSVNVSFEVTFDGGIHMRGSGEIPVQHISAP